MKKQFILIIFFSYQLASLAQDGRIISQASYHIADSSIKQWQKTVPDLSSILNSINIYSIAYSSDGLKVTGYFSEPKKEGKYPVIIYNRGGNRNFGALSDGQIIRILSIVSSWGYICIASQYRGNGGGQGREEFGGEEVHDILNLIPCLNAIKKADTSRIGMWGWSRGGMMTYLALTKTNKIKAAVVSSGMADAFETTKRRPEMDTVFSELAPGYFLNRDSVLRARSAVYWVDKICSTTPLLIITGSADWRVSADEQMEMVDTLYKLKRPVRFQLFEGGQHNLSEFFNEVNETTKLFFDKYVRDSLEHPQMELHGN
jgi:dipeptidyl aminopeptidase/acylaminoacyl peptidase